MTSNRNNDYERYDARNNRRNETSTAGHSSGTREGSYASALRGDNRSIPIHEKISLSRRTSRRNVNERYENQENQAQQTPKNGPTAQGETGPNPNNSEITNMRNYLAEVMAAISGFESRLSAQQEQPRTPSDRS